MVNGRAWAVIGLLLAATVAGQLPEPLTASAPVAPAAAEDVRAAMAKLGNAHPRLFLDATATLPRLAASATNPLMAEIQQRLLTEADRAVLTSPVERVLTGRRMLHVSRTALSRIMHLSWAWQNTGQAVYLERAKAELLAVAAFTDWHPDHFLDVAEMTMAAGIGYDWLYAGLDEPTRQLIRRAIVEKGLRPSLAANHWWIRGTNNWNPVCHAGLTVGALAIAEHEPELAAAIVERAVRMVPRAMREYAPDGAYPEGPSYWSYGTHFTVILIDALQSALKSDFGLTAQPGFLATADYFLHVIGPTGYSFNYSDARREGGPDATQFWLTRQRGQPWLLASERLRLAQQAQQAQQDRDADLPAPRTGPLLVLWTLGTPPAESARAVAPPVRSWTGHGSNPVAFHRSDWTADAVYVATKGGSASLSHAHMDAGSFVMDADGVRWAEDLGMQDYHSLESVGITLWHRDQDAERWGVFRIGSASHNVLQVDGRQQRVDGQAPIVSTGDGFTVIDLATTYAGQLAAVRRGIALIGRTVLVQDELVGLAQAADVRWAMATEAEVVIAGPRLAILSRGGKKLELRVVEPAEARLAIHPTDPPPLASDAANPGTCLIGFTASVAPGQAQRLVVHLVPASAGETPPPTVKPLAAWRAGQ